MIDPDEHNERVRKATDEAIARLEKAIQPKWYERKVPFWYVLLLSAVYAVVIAWNWWATR